MPFKSQALEATVAPATSSLCDVRFRGRSACNAGRSGAGPLPRRQAGSLWIKALGNFWIVMRAVLGASRQLKVFQSVVSFDSILVVDDFVAPKEPAERDLHDMAVLIAPAVDSHHLDVAVLVSSMSQRIEALRKRMLGVLGLSPRFTEMGRLPAFSQCGPLFLNGFLAAFMSQCERCRRCTARHSTIMTPFRSGVYA
jgi:hypothetical protein